MRDPTARSVALVTPLPVCSWGPMCPDGDDQKFKRRQRLYLSEQVRHLSLLSGNLPPPHTHVAFPQTDGSEPNKLVVMDVDIAKVCMHNNNGIVQQQPCR